MDDAIIEVLEQYHARMERENLSFPVAAPGGRNSVNFQSMRAIGPETGQFLNILVHSLTAPRILELGQDLSGPVREPGTRPGPNRDQRRRML